MHTSIGNSLARGVTALLLFLAPGASAEVFPLGAHPVEASRAISLLIAAGDPEGGADLAAHLSGGKSRDQMLPIIKQMTDLGPSQYMDRVYARALGTSSYDIIDKLNLAKAVIFVRYLFSVEHGQWQLVNIAFQAELGVSLPREWVHIYPDPAGPGEQ